MNFIGLRTLFFKETLRFFKVILQTVAAPVITTLLYFLVFSHVLDQRVEIYSGVSYRSFIVPGLIMMAMIQNAFANTSSSLIQSKVTGNIIFILLPPMSPFEMLLAFTGAAVLRALVVGLAVYAVAIWFTPAPVTHWGYLVAFSLLASTASGILGIIGGIWAEKFDQIAAFTNFVVLPLTFLSGVFYSIHTLSPAWQTISKFNPFVYMIDGFRYAFLSVADFSPLVSLAVVTGLLTILTFATLALLRSGYKLRD